jgi:apolipoprotein D and lipocalin family protein
MPILAKRFIKIHFLMLLIALTGCATGPPIETVNSVNIERFMGDWYVIANIPHAIEKDAFNAVESYRLAEDGTIETTFTFNKGSFDGPLKTYKPRGFIQDKESNAVWGMQFFWPIKAEYRIIYLTEDYTQTVNVWIMARKPYIPDDDYNRILDFIKSQGYDLSKLQKVPQRVR